ncbi:MAG: MaoC family dehydratase N-terminal domain-containing protein [Nocardia sp.]|nr:MaoC family dehydratase N-terminal domain-containing protein [Nocardia sp.]
MSDFTVRTEYIDDGPAEGLAALLDVPLPDLDTGLPLLWHWVYLLDRAAQADLGADGHPVRHAVPAPPEPGRRRMWAGGQVRMLAPLRTGRSATRRTQVTAVEDKQGRSGRLTFVTVSHQITQADTLVIDERQDIVYRDAPPAQQAGAPQMLPEMPVAQDDWPITVTPTLLFRYSALTYNAHRIHYDRDYARDIEGYPGLLTHGPLQAVAMAEAARARGHRASDTQVFDYRLVSPLFDHQGLIARADPSADGGRISTSVRDKFGRETATGVLS